MIANGGLHTIVAKFWHFEKLLQAKVAHIGVALDREVARHYASRLVELLVERGLQTLHLGYLVGVSLWSDTLLELLALYLHRGFGCGNIDNKLELIELVELPCG